MEEVRCSLCGSELAMFHRGTRDYKDIDVLKCNKCGLLQLSRYVTSDSYYQTGEIHKNQYHSSTDEIQDETWELWVEETSFDDDRRKEQLHELVKGKRVLDFGCGNGGFIKRITGICDVSGVELDSDARNHLVTEGLTVKERISEFDFNFDVITLFQVLEHLTDPDDVVQSIKSKLLSAGVLVVETPNSEDALISLYNNKAFCDFTFWSNHVMLYNSQNLDMLMSRNGFRVVERGQVQRYPLSNHLFWLAKERPGGHIKWDWLNDNELNQHYEKALRAKGICDTLFSIYCVE